jgi:hypothetical protein
MSLNPQHTLARRRAQPTAVYIARLTATATFAYLLASVIPMGTSRPVLAPLTALLVLQASLYQTLRIGFRTVIAGIAGVVAAVAISGFVPFNWWVLGLLTAGTLLLGHLLRLGAESLNVPTGAIIIFSTSAGANAAATGRIIDTLAGVAAGLLGGVLFAPLRVQTAREAVGDLADQLATLLDRMTGGLSAEPDPDQVGEWLQQARDLRGDIERVDDTLRQAEDSTRLNPRILGQASLPPGTEIALRHGLETLEHAALSLRFLASSVIDATRVSGEESPVRDADTRAHLAAVLTMTAAAIRTYGRMVRTLPHGSEAVKSALTAELDAARLLQTQLARHLEPRAVPEGAYSEWPVRGEILCHVDRLRAGLEVDITTQVRSPRPRVRPGAARTIRPIPMGRQLRMSRQLSHDTSARRDAVLRSDAVPRRDVVPRRDISPRHLTPKNTSPRETSPRHTGPGDTGPLDIRPHDLTS